MWVFACVCMSIYVWTHKDTGMASLLFSRASFELLRQCWCSHPETIQGPLLNEVYTPSCSGQLPECSTISLLSISWEAQDRKKRGRQGTLRATKDLYNHHPHRHSLCCCSHSKAVYCSPVGPWEALRVLLQVCAAASHIRCPKWLEDKRDHRASE